MTYRVGPRRYVVDTSVVLKWQLDDEDDVPQALALRDACLVDGAVELHAPMMLAYELTNALRTAERRFRLSPELTTEALANLMASGIELHEPAAARRAAVRARAGYQRVRRRVCRTGSRAWRRVLVGRRAAGPRRLAARTLRALDQRVRPGIALARVG